MARPCKFRRISQEYGIGFFGPKGVPLRELELVVLGHEEVEALRLADVDGLYHEEAAATMGVSRPTFGRILESARHKLALALITGKGIQVNGGNYLIGAGYGEGQKRRRYGARRVRDVHIVERKEE